MMHLHRWLLNIKTEPAFYDTDIPIYFGTKKLPGKHSFIYIIPIQTAHQETDTILINCVCRFIKI